jgi:SAM-dependent methyltransferase
MKFKQIIKNIIPSKIMEMLYSAKYYKSKLQSAKIYQEILRGKVGVEIGGPSIFFKYIVPVYPIILGLDGVNFSEKTMWEGAICSGKNFKYYKGSTGFQYISEATDLGLIKANSYEFLLSSNCLEHVANPLKALEEWVRIVSPGGYILLLLPNKMNNFDHRRPATSFDHILQDYEKGITEKDLTHLPEILELHDLSLDPMAGNYEDFKNRSLDNFSNRGLHHHVFDMTVIRMMFDFFKIEIIQNEMTSSDYIFMGRIAK